MRLKSRGPEAYKPTSAPRAVLRRGLGDFKWGLSQEGGGAGSALVAMSLLGKPVGPAQLQENSGPPFPPHRDKKIPASGQVL